MIFNDGNSTLSNQLLVLKEYGFGIVKCQGEADMNEDLRSELLHYLHKIWVMYHKEHLWAKMNKKGNMFQFRPIDLRVNSITCINHCTFYPTQWNESSTNMVKWGCSWWHCWQKFNMCYFVDMICILQDQVVHLIEHTYPKCTKGH